MPIALGAKYTCAPKMECALLKQIEQLRILLEDDHAVPGTLEGRTIAALKGNHLRAVHRNVHDVATGLSGSRIDVGDPRGPALRLKATGPSAPVICVRNPRRGMTSLYESVVPSILAGVGSKGSERQERAWLLCSLLIVDRIVEAGGPWGDWHSLEVVFPSTLSPLAVTSIRPGNIREAISNLSNLFEDSHPANRVTGALKTMCFEPALADDEVCASVEPHAHHYEYDELPALDAMARLRILAELEGLLP